MHVAGGEDNLKITGEESKLWRVVSLILSMASGRIRRDKESQNGRTRNGIFGCTVHFLLSLLTACRVRCRLLNGGSWVYDS